MEVAGPRTKTIGFHLHEVFRIGGSIETERLVADGLVEGECGLSAHGYKASLRSSENFATK